MILVYLKTRDRFDSHHAVWHFSLFPTTWGTSLTHNLGSVTQKKSRLEMTRVPVLSSFVHVCSCLLYSLLPGCTKTPCGNPEAGIQKRTAPDTVGVLVGSRRWGLGAWRGGERMLKFVSWFVLLHKTMGGNRRWGQPGHWRRGSSRSKEVNGSVFSGWGPGGEVDAQRMEEDFFYNRNNWLDFFCTSQGGEC